MGSNMRVRSAEHKQTSEDSSKKLTNIELGPRAPGELRRMGSLGNSERLPARRQRGQNSLRVH